MPRGRIARWILTIQSYQFTIVHRKGSLNQDADALSRIQLTNQQEVSTVSMATMKQKQLVDPFIKLIKGEVKLPYGWNQGILCYKKPDKQLIALTSVDMCMIVTDGFWEENHVPRLCDSIAYGFISRYDTPKDSGLRYYQEVSRWLDWWTLWGRQDTDEDQGHSLVAIYGGRRQGLWCSQTIMYIFGHIIKRANDFIQQGHQLEKSFQKKTKNMRTDISHPTVFSTPEF
ncbi:hypothetical protein [Absidia glauca]|uniref:Reverse transcriptase RNase H-like domain-containing protein n=1 Tax=Absidia glauca TaxID=4829 RepID=A0A168PDL5_ABSGL|nr:hypothetical protein [Absidia glauca]